jgi:hypothetical protein
MTAAAAANPFASKLATKAEAETLLQRMLETMDATIHVLEAETALVRKGKLVEAGRLQPDKAELARRFTNDMRVVQDNGATLKRLAPEMVERVRGKHERFRAELQINMTVLATAKALAESIVQEIAESVARQDVAAGYGASGVTRNALSSGARPVALSRSV